MIKEQTFSSCFFECDGTRILDGRLLARSVYDQLVPWISCVKQALDRPPSLHVVRVGSYPPSLVYISRKQAMCQELGIASEIHVLSESATSGELTDLLERLNSNSSVDGILLQMPLPPHLPSQQMIDVIDPDKDVDGLTTTNLTRLYMGQDGLKPCTPLGVVHILKATLGNIEGRHVAILGRSLLVGKSLFSLLLNENATTTLLHSRSQNIESITQSVDAVVVAIGRPHFLKASHVSQKSIVVDVGITPNEQGRVIGDVDFESVVGRVSMLTPVPYGVGPMTIAALMANTVRAACYKAMKKGVLHESHLQALNPFPIGGCV